jgi:hypothetical protein
VIRTTGNGAIVIVAAGTPWVDAAVGVDTGAAAGGGIGGGAVDAGGGGATGGGVGGGADTVTSLDVLLTLPLSLCTCNITV